MAKNNGDKPTRYEERKARKYEKIDPELTAALRKPPKERTWQDNFLIAARLTYWSAREGTRLETYAG